MISICKLTVWQYDMLSAFKQKDDLFINKQTKIPHFESVSCHMKRLDVFLDF